MSTFSPERALARPASGRPRWTEGWLAAALWLLGGLYTLAWPDAGRRWPFSEGWALAQFTLGGGLLVLALSYRYWRQRGRVCSMPESGWRCCRCSLRCGKG